MRVASVFVKFPNLVRTLITPRQQISNDGETDRKQGKDFSEKYCISSNLFLQFGEILIFRELWKLLEQIWDN